MVKDFIKRYLPPKLTYKITHIKKTLQPFGFSKATFSGNGEDILLNEYLFKNQANGFYVDVGCFHPKLISNTHLLHKKGWTGINIDPNPETISLFNKYRPEDVNIQAGVAATEEELIYYNFSHAGINTFSKEHADKKNSKAWSTLLSAEPVKCYPLSTILERYLPANTQIDLLDIDVEELDLQVLRSNNWDKYRPRVVLVEDRDFRKQMTDSEVYKYLVGQGYTFYSYCEMTLIMIDSSSFT